jgi:two-component system, chemotaxis family, chemotaxis protein CheY
VPSMASYVLVVDDDLAIVAMVRALLEMEGYAVRTATNGQDALRRVEQELPALPDVVLLDLRMPVMDGWQFSRSFRERWGFAVPFIVMSASVDTSAWARQVEAEAFLSKPFELTTLLLTVERMVGERQGRVPQNASR